MIIFRTHKIFDGGISGHTVLQVGPEQRFGPQATIAGGTDALGKAGIPVLHFLLKRHRLPSFPVGKARAVPHQVGGNDFPGNSSAGQGCAGIIRIGRVGHIEFQAVIPGQDDFLVGPFRDIILGEQADITGLLALAGIDGVTASRNEFIGGIGGLLQIIAVRKRIGGERLEEDIPGVVFPERSFKQAEAGLQGQGGPFGDAVIRMRGRKLFDGEIDILDHPLHHVIAAVTGLIEIVVVRAQGMVVPRHIAEFLDFLEVEPGTEESNQGDVLIPDFLVLAVAAVLQEGIDSPQVRPVPAAVAGIDGPAAADLRIQFPARNGIALAAAEESAREHRVQGVRICLHLRFRREEGFGRELVLREPVQHPLAGDQQHRAADCEYIFFHLDSP